MKKDRIPSGIPEFDIVVGGGFPKGSTILLLGEHGSGYREFAITSASRILLAKKNTDLRHFLLGNASDLSVLPKKVAYLSFTSPKEDILYEIKESFNEDYYEILKEKIEFTDLSSAYFRHTIVPSSWSNEDLLTSLAGSDSEPPLNSLVKFFENNGKDSLVIIDSLSDLLISSNVKFEDVIVLLKGIKRRSKIWGGIVYFYLTDSITDKEKINALGDCVDGIIKFEWVKNIRTSKRQRSMHIEKFMPLLVHVNEMRVSRFAIDISPMQGLVVSDYERV